MTDDHDDARAIDEFLASLGPVDESKRPPNWPSRHRIGLLFPPARRPGEPVATAVSVTVRLSNLQSHFINRAAVAAGVEHAVWVQRHLLAAAGCPPPKVPVAMETLEHIYASHALLDSLLVKKQ